MYIYIYIFCIFCKYKYYTHTIYNCAGCSFHKNLYVPRVQQQLHSGTTDSTEDPTFRPNSLCKSPLRHWSTSMSLTLHPDDSSQDNLAVSRNTCRSGRIAFRWVCMYISYIILYIYIHDYIHILYRQRNKKDDVFLYFQPMHQTSTPNLINKSPIFTAVHVLGLWGFGNLLPGIQTQCEKLFSGRKPRSQGQSPMDVWQILTVRLCVIWLYVSGPKKKCFHC